MQLVVSATVATFSAIYVFDKRVARSVEGFDFRLSMSRSLDEGSQSFGCFEASLRDFFFLGFFLLSSISLNLYRCSVAAPSATFMRSSVWCRVK